MRSFGAQLMDLLPAYLTSESKGRLSDALSQFSLDNISNISYRRFYQDAPADYFFQGDLVREIRFPMWDSDTLIFNKKYLTAIILSNTCDISSSNSRNANVKQCVMAPVIPLPAYTAELVENGYPQNSLDSFTLSIRRQQITNLFYLPSHDGTSESEMVALLDQVSWFPTEELNTYATDMRSNRMRSMSLYGSYLLALKMSFHFCRLPEEEERSFAE